MWDKVKTIHLDETGAEIVQWHPTSSIEDVAAAMFVQYPNAVIEIKLV